MSVFQSVRNILVLAPHTDDGEFGCGATIARLLDEGAQVHYAAFSLAEESVPVGFPKNILEVEVKAATKKLGIAPDNLYLYRYPVRKLSYHRQDILENLVELNNRLHPDIVFMPCMQDLHQDHSTVSLEGLRAFKKTTILAYEMPWNNLNFSTQGFVTVTEENLNRKIAAIDCYDSQKHRSYVSGDFIRSLAVTRGVQVGRQFAEAFEVVRWLI